MNQIETIEQFYQHKDYAVPDELRRQIGHFNVFRLEPVAGRSSYRRRDFFKITLVSGGGEMHYADKMVKVNQHALVFSNPMIPYTWEKLDEITSGYYCVFTQDFFHKQGDLNQYPVFQAGSTHVFDLTDQEAEQVGFMFAKMLDEINSNYIFKYDILRNIIFDLLHFAMKMQPSVHLEKHPTTATQRISSLFLELLERQFPIDDAHPQITLRSASDFAEKLNIHVNHLNRVVKEAAGKTTTQLIAERVLQEAKILLKHSSWNIAEIAYALGFSEATHFNNFFKKHVQISPSQYRNV